MRSLTLIVAHARGRVIGRDGGMPWHHPADLRHFKAQTMGHHCLCGRVTWESLGRPLPGRHLIVISRQPGYQAPGASAVVGSLAEALDRARAADPEPMVIGGAAIYEETLPIATRLLITDIDEDHPGDTWFPAYAAADWHEVERRVDGPLCFRDLRRKPVSP